VNFTPGKMFPPDFVDLNQIAAGCFGGTDKSSAAYKL